MQIEKGKQDFSDKKEALISLFNRIPSEETLNYFIQSCFLNTESMLYQNLNEEDRKHAYFFNFKGNEQEYTREVKEYYSKFLDKDEIDDIQVGLNHHIDRSGVKKFDDFEISSSSIEILNYNFFEYKLEKIIIEFRKLYSSTIIEHLKSDKHQLFVLNDNLIQSKKLYSRLEKIELDVPEIDYDKFRDLIHKARVELKTLMDSFFELIKANNQDIVTLYDNSRELSLEEVIKKEWLGLFYEFEKYLISQTKLDSKSKIWKSGYGCKSSFMRFYKKCEDLDLVKYGNRKILIRKLSDIYKIKGVNKYDYGSIRCQEAYEQNTREYDELNTIKSQYILNFKNKMF